MGAGAADFNVATTQIVVDGRVYGDASELPPEARRKYEAAMRRLDADGNGVPDMLEGSAPLVAAGAARSPSAGAPIVGASPQVESTDRRFWLGLVVVMLIIAAVMAVWLGPSLLAR